MTTSAPKPSQEIKVESKAAAVDSKESQESKMLLTPEDVQKVKEKLKDAPTGRYKKQDLGIPYSIIKIKDEKNGDKYFAIDKGKKHGKHLGEGQYGKAKRLQDVDTGKLWALKIMQRQNEHSLEEAQHEAKILHKLNRAYPDVITRAVKPSNDEEAALFQKSPELAYKDQFITQLESGMTLAKYFEQHHDKASINSMTAAEMMLGLLYAVKEVHAEGVLHCDINPKNVVFDEKTKGIALIDFGTAVTAEDKVYQYYEGAMHNYMAPELHISEAPAKRDAKADVYAVGYLFLNFLHCTSTPEQPAELYRLAMQMGEHDPGNRPTVNEAIKVVSACYAKLKSEASAKAWLQDAVTNKLPELYGKIETGRGKNLEKIIALKKQLAKSNLTSFDQLLTLVKNEYEKSQNAWCKPGFFSSKEKTPADYAAHLNKNATGHHYARMLATILKTAYQNHPELLPKQASEPAFMQVIANSRYDFSQIAVSDKKAEVAPLRCLSAGRGSR